MARRVGIGTPTELVARPLTARDAAPLFEPVLGAVTRAAYERATRAAVNRWGFAGVGIAAVPPRASAGRERLARTSEGEDGRATARQMHVPAAPFVAVALLSPVTALPAAHPLHVSRAAAMDSSAPRPGRRAALLWLQADDPRQARELTRALTIALQGRVDAVDAIGTTVPALATELVAPAPILRAMGFTKVWGIPGRYRLDLSRTAVVLPRVTERLAIPRLVRRPAAATRTAANAQ